MSRLDQRKLSLQAVWLSFGMSVFAAFVLAYRTAWCEGQSKTLQARERIAQIDARLAPKIERALASSLQLRKAEQRYQELLERVLKQIDPEDAALIEERGRLRQQMYASLPRRVPWSEVLWIGAGLLGQLCFSARFLVQWLVSERKGQSVVPLSFWYFSLLGGLILFTYAVHRRDPVFILGQSMGVFVYTRNLILIRRERKRGETEAEEQPTNR